MKRIDWYQEMEEENLPLKKYLSVFIILSLFLSFIFSVKVDTNLPVRLIKKEEGYEGYLSQEQLDRIETKGVLLTHKNKYHYTLNPVIDSQLTLENSSYYLVRFQFQEECDETMLSGRISISRNTILKRIISLWKEDAK